MTAVVRGHTSTTGSGGRWSLRVFTNPLPRSTSVRRLLPMRDERGTVTAFVTILAVALLAVVGLVADGGFLLAARRQAFDEAEAAARAGAQAVDIDSVRSGGPVRIDPDAARARALDYLASTGHEGSVSVNGDVVRVQVRFRREMTVLGLIGLGPAAIEGDGEARGVRGVTRGDE